jgi:ATP-dependent RNA helicase DDX18/HAS1
MGSAKSSKKRKPVAPPPESDSEQEETVPETADEEEEQQKEAGDEEQQQGEAVGEDGEQETGSEKKKIKKKEKEGSGILTTVQFADLPISKLTADAIREMNYTHLAQVRAASPLNFDHPRELLPVFARNDSIKNGLCFCEIFCSVPWYTVLN